MKRFTCIFLLLLVLLVWSDPTRQGWNNRGYGQVGYNNWGNRGNHNRQGGWSSHPYLGRNNYGNRGGRGNYGGYYGGGGYTGGRSHGGGGYYGGYRGGYGGPRGVVSSTRVVRVQRTGGGTVSGGRRTGYYGGGRYY